MGFEVHEKVSRIKIHMNEQSRALKIMRIFSSNDRCFLFEFKSCNGPGYGKESTKKYLKADDDFDWFRVPCLENQMLN